MTLRKPPKPVSDWYRMARNEATSSGQSSADVYIYDAIGGWFGIRAAEFVQELAALDVDRINLWVNSPGGDVYDGVAIRNAIRRHPAHVVATVDGLAASAASFIIQAADEIVMAGGSEIAIHDAWGICIGPAADMHEFGDQLDRLSNSIAGLYADRAGGTREQWREAMRAETWYSAEEAVAAGLADRKDGATTSSDDSASNLFDLSIFAHAGRAAAPAPWMPQAHAQGRTRKPPAEPVEDHTPTMEGADAMSDTLAAGLRERLGLTAEAALDEPGLLAKLDEALARPATDNHQSAPPEGTVLVDETVLAELRADAQAGRQAREQQIAAERAAAVQAAVDDGRIAPARRDHWIAALAADPGAVEVLASLAKGTVPLQPKGYTGGVDEASDEDRLYSKLYTTPKEG